jgi:translation initiation factor 1A
MAVRPSKFHDQRRGAAVVYQTKMPGQGELVGVVEKASGSASFVVRCNDGKDRLCTIPGRLKRKFWIKIKDVVIVKPWVVQSDERADILWRYSIMDGEKLRNAGLLKDL